MCSLLLGHGGAGRTIGAFRRAAVIACSLAWEGGVRGRLECAAVFELDADPTVPGRCGEVTIR